MNDTATSSRIVIVGAGYAGRAAAARLSRLLPTAALTIVDPRRTLLERVRIPELLAGRAKAPRPLTEVVPRSCGLVHSRAIRWDDSGVWLDTGVFLPADAVIVATGSRTRQPPVGCSIDDPEIPALLARLRGTGGRVAVVGGGTSGVEVATELAEACDRSKVAVTLIAPTLLPTLSRRAQTHAARVAARLGVDWRAARAEVQTGSEGSALWCEGAPVEADLVLWAVGFEAVRPGGDTRLAVSPELRLAGHDRVFAIGDVAGPVGPDGRVFRPSCAAGMPMGMHAASNVARLLTGRALLPFRFRFILVCVSLGRRDGVVQLVDALERPTRSFTGRPAAWVKELITRMTIALPNLEWRWRMPAYSWPQPRLGAP